MDPRRLLAVGFVSLAFFVGGICTSLLSIRSGAHTAALNPVGEKASLLDSFNVFLDSMFGVSENQSAQVVPSTVTSPADAPPSVYISSITLTAAAPSGAAVQFKADGVNWGGQLVSVPYSATWNAGNAPLGSHTLVATGRDMAGNTMTSALVTVVVADTLAPTAPANLSASAVSPSQINVSWNAASDNVGVSGYRVYRNGSLLTTLAGTSYQDINLPQGTTYSYTVAAYDAIGNVSAPSATANATTLVPAPTISLTASAASLTQGSSATLAWTSTNTTGCTASGAWTGAKSVSGTQSVSPVNTSTYTLVCTGSGGTASASVTLTVTAPIDATAPTVPPGLTVTPTASASMTLTWMPASDNVGVTGYQIERCSVASCTASSFAKIATATTTFYTNTNLSPATKYTYRIRAQDAAGNLSPYSGWFSDTTLSNTTSTLKYHPGHYIQLNGWECYADKDCTNAILTAISKPGVDGVLIRYLWAELEPSYNVYDFSRVLANLKLVSDHGKRLIVRIEDKTYLDTMPTPPYLQKDYTVPHDSATGGYVATRWQPYVTDRFAALTYNLGKAVDSNPYFEGLNFEEQALSFSQPATIAKYCADPYDYTPEKYRDETIRMLENTRAQFPTSQVFWMMNFMTDCPGNTYAQTLNDQIINAIIPYHVAMGGPDILPDNASLARLTYPYYVAYKDKMTLFGSIEYASYYHLHDYTSTNSYTYKNKSTYGYSTKYWTMNELFQYARDQLGVKYVFWNMKEPSQGPSDSYNWDPDAIAVIGNNPSFSIPDTTAPNVSLGSPISGATISGTITVSANASDLQGTGQSISGMAGVQFKLDGVNLGSEILTAPYMFSLNTTTLSNGAHTIAATARDQAGNTNTANISVTVSNALPAASAITAGSRVKVAVGPLNVRSTSVATSAIMGSEPAGSYGTVIGGPIVSGNYTRWNINYDNGLTGWSVEEGYLSAYNPSVSSSVKYHPGDYIAMVDGDAQSAMVSAMQEPGVTGINKRYFWKDLEPTQGNYNFSQIQSDLALAAQNGKQLVVMIVDKSFNTVVPTPPYLANYTLPLANGGYIAERWSPIVVARLSALTQALGNQFDKNPNFEGVAFQESSVGISPATEATSGYTPELYRDSLIQMLTNARKGLPTSAIFWYMNFLDENNAYLDPIAAAVAPYKIYMGGPDILPDNPALNRWAYPLYTKYLGQMKLFGSVQNVEYGTAHTGTSYATKYWTMNELLQYARTNLHVNYIFWTRKTWKDPADSYTWLDALPVIQANPTINR